ncbi:SMP-30/gluconolactonase/LRE family protein [Pantanalinema sp. GBBB05]|uniref:SMP-30/gluconolactonase/LRE family protein n=1 Tax=Pantanalinema sp. GBBB05 TaxID=2604139 RepID=UPI001DB51A76|nr:SMP-30/gluconolactonase/LRE family protein [Pantanalinema sp. GBBB05]
MTSNETQASNTIAIYDDRMTAIVDPDATLQKLADGAVHTEGSVYLPKDESVVYSDAHDNRLLRWSAKDGVTVLRHPSDYQNGNCLDLDNRLVSCSGGLRAIIRQEPNGEWIVLVDRYQGKRLNSPNDLVVKRDGSIWFTDPPYGITEPNQGYGGEQEQPGSYVYRFDPATGVINAIVTDMLRPNGLTFSPDECTLYVSDSSAFNLPDGYHYIRAYDVVSDRQVANGRVFAVIDPGQPDGLCVDEPGHVFATAQDGVQIYTSEGTLLGKILVPEVCANITFGGKTGNRLFIAAGHALYAIDLKTKGVK